jgi:hypothetical protein
LLPAMNEFPPKVPSPRLSSIFGGPTATEASIRDTPSREASPQRPEKTRPDTGLPRRGSLVDSTDITQRTRATLPGTAATSTGDEPPPTAARHGPVATRPAPNLKGIAQRLSPGALRLAQVGAAFAGDVDADSFQKATFKPADAEHLQACRKELEQAGMLTAGRLNAAAADEIMKDTHPSLSTLLRTIHDFHQGTASPEDTADRLLSDRSPEGLAELDRDLASRAERMGTEPYAHKRSEAAEVIALMLASPQLDKAQQARILDHPALAAPACQALLLASPELDAKSRGRLLARPQLSERDGMPRLAVAHHLAGEVMDSRSAVGEKALGAFIELHTECLLSSSGAVRRASIRALGDLFQDAGTPWERKSTLRTHLTKLNEHRLLSDQDLQSILRADLPIETWDRVAKFSDDASRVALLAVNQRSRKSVRELFRQEPEAARAASAVRLNALAETASRNPLSPPPGPSASSIGGMFSAFVNRLSTQAAPIDTARVDSLLRRILADHPAISVNDDHPRSDIVLDALARHPGLVQQVGLVLQRHSVALDPPLQPQSSNDEPSHHRTLREAALRLNKADMPGLLIDMKVDLPKRPSPDGVQRSRLDRFVNQMVTDMMARPNPGESTAQGFPFRKSAREAEWTPKLDSLDLSRCEGVDLAYRTHLERPLTRLNLADSTLYARCFSPHDGVLNRYPVRALDLSGTVAEHPGCQPLEKGWLFQNLSAHFSQAHCRLEELRMRDSTFKGTELVDLAFLLRGSATMRTLDIANPFGHADAHGVAVDRSPEAAQAFADHLFDPGQRLERIDIGQCNFDWPEDCIPQVLKRTMAHLARGTTGESESPLRYLDLSGTGATLKVETLIEILQHPCCSLQTLNLSGTRLEGDRRRLEELDVPGLRLIMD